MYISRGNPTLKNLVISANTINAYGAGLYNSDGTPTLTKVALRSNPVTNSNGFGAMANYQGNPMLINVLFSGNDAVLGGGLHTHLGSATLINTTFSGNKSSESGAIFINTSNVTLRNAISWSNSSAIEGNVPAIVTNSIVQGGYIGGNQEVEPHSVAQQPYTSAPSTGGDYRLQAGSVAIDAGDNSVVTALTDLNGNPRLVDGDGNGGIIVDMGAYEWSPYSLFLPLITR